mmetsp:Transcript_11482/g.24867  ORF Transcript_11482/g.24867 Transcript_11482/m.24867 type:complete len:314 (-) Transcript_11482:251-1192(-)
MQVATLLGVTVRQKVDVKGLDALLVEAAPLRAGGGGDAPLLLRAPDDLAVYVLGGLKRAGEGVGVSADAAAAEVPDCLARLELPGSAVFAKELPKVQEELRDPPLRPTAVGVVVVVDFDPQQADGVGPGREGVVDHVGLLLGEGRAGEALVERARLVKLDHAPAEDVVAGLALSPAGLVDKVERLARGRGVAEDAPVVAAELRDAGGDGLAEQADPRRLELREVVEERRIGHGAGRHGLSRAVVPPGSVGDDVVVGPVRDEEGCLRGGRRRNVSAGVGRGGGDEAFDGAARVHHVQRLDGAAGESMEVHGVGV